MRVKNGFDIIEPTKKNNFYSVQILNRVVGEIMKKENRIKFQYDIKEKSFKGFKQIKTFVKSLYKEEGKIYKDSIIDPLLKKVVIYLNHADITNRRVEVIINNRMGLRTLLTILDKHRVIKLHIPPPNRKLDCTTFFPATNFEHLLVGCVPYFDSVLESSVDIAETLPAFEKKDDLKVYEAIPPEKNEEFGLDILEKFNKFNKNHQFKLGSVLLSTNLRRIFKHTNWDIRDNVADEGITEYQFGRFYGNDLSPMSIKSEQRKEITIDGEPTIEIDYRSLGANIIYALAGYDTLPDAYDVGDDSLTRDKLKFAMMVMIFADSKGGAIKACRKEWTTVKEGDFAIPEVPSDREILPYINALEKKHEKIKNYLYQNLSGEIQRLDSQLILNIMKDALKNEIPFYPIHDSIIIREMDREWGISIMKKVFMDLFGKDIAVKIEETIDMDILEEFEDDEPKQFYDPILREFEKEDENKFTVDEEIIGAI